MSKFDAVAAYFTHLLMIEGISFKVEPLYDGYKWTFSDLPGDIAIHSGTYYSDEDYLESYGMPWDNDDVSICTPNEMVRRLSGKEPHTLGERKYTFNDAINSIQTLLEKTENDEVR